MYEVAVRGRDMAPASSMSLFGQEALHLPADDLLVLLRPKLPASQMAPYALNDDKPPTCQVLHFFLAVLGRKVQVRSRRHQEDLGFDACQRLFQVFPSRALAYGRDVASDPGGQHAQQVMRVQ